MRKSYRGERQGQRSVLFLDAKLTEPDYGKLCEKRSDNLAHMIFYSQQIPTQQVFRHCQPRIRAPTTVLSLIYRPYLKDCQLSDIRRCLDMIVAESKILVSRYLVILMNNKPHQVLQQLSSLEHTSLQNIILRLRPNSNVRLSSCFVYEKKPTTATIRLFVIHSILCAIVPELPFSQM